MFEKNMKLAYLLDFYVDLLDEHSANIMRAYYEDDLSLAEIASGIGISRQGIRHVIKKCEEQILFLEEKLGLMQRQEELERAAEILKRVRDDLPSPQQSSVDEAIEILNKGV